MGSTTAAGARRQILPVDRARAARRRWLFTVFGAGLAVGLGAVPARGIGLTQFSMSPAGGPAGTNVSVSGTGCAPGLVLSPSRDYVTVGVGTVPPVSARIAVASNGSWSGTVTIPANAAAAPALVSVVCFSDGVQSLLTIYEPKTFTVTGAAATTTTSVTAPPTTGAPPDTSTTLSTAPFGETTTTVPGAGAQPPTTVPAGGDPAPGGPPPPGTAPKPSAHGGRGGGSGPDGSQPSATTSVPGADPATPGSSTDDPSGAASGAHAERAARSVQGSAGATGSYAATLSDPSLAGRRSATSSGLGWLRWLLFALVVLAGAGAGAWTWRKHREAPDDQGATPMSEDVDA